MSNCSVDIIKQFHPVKIIYKQPSKKHFNSRLMFRCLLTFLLLAVFNQNLLARAKLIIPQDFNLIAINGHRYSSPILQTTDTVPLAIGTNRIALEYEKLWDDDYSESFSTVKSKVFLVQFSVNKDNNSQNETLFRLTYIKPYDMKASEKFAKNPRVNVLTPQSSTLNSQQSTPSIQRLSHIIQLTAGVKSHLDRPILNSNKPIRITSNKNTRKQKDVSKQQDVSAQLDYWWSKATKEERKKFLEKINAEIIND